MGNFFQWIYKGLELPLSAESDGSATTVVPELVLAGVDWLLADTCCGSASPRWDRDSGDQHDYIRTAPTWMCQTLLRNV